MRKLVETVVSKGRIFSAGTAEKDAQGVPDGPWWSESATTKADRKVEVALEVKGADGDEVEGESLDDLTVAELKERAEEQGIDLGGATKKADIIAAIESGDGIQTVGADEEE